jgi:hypothetical protein
MRIENTSLQPSGASSPVDKLRRPGSSMETTMEDLDLSFMDLLSNIVSEALVSAPPASKAEPKEKSKPAAATETKESPGATKLSLVGKVSTTRENEAMDAVDHDMALLKDALTPADVQYLKQAVIPGLPILMGTVPSNSVFPTGEDGEISYRGFDVSPKLSELIEKGYRSGRPIRVELDSNSAVVIKIRNGQVSAQFVSSDKNASMGMQQGLDDLRNRMLARNLPVGQLEYQYRDPGQPQKQDQPEDSQESAQSENE